MRNSSTYVYLAVALGLLCYVVFIDKKLPGTKETEKAETQLYAYDPDSVIGLEISNVHNTFIFQKRDGHWELRKPVDTLADGTTVDGIIDQISNTQPQRTIQVDGDSDKDKANLKEWGLVPPAERVVIHTKDKQFELLVGRKTAISDSVYVRTSGRKNEPVRIVSNTIKQALQKDLTDFRSRSVFDFNTQKAIKVATRVADTPTTPAQQCELDLKDGKWMLQLPLVARTSEPDVQMLLNKILGEKIVDFVTDDSSNLSTYGLASPTATFTVTIKGDDGKPDEDLVLEVGGPVPGKPDQVYAQKLKSSSVFTLNKQGIDDLIKAVPNVRDHHVMPLDANQVTGIGWTLGAKKAQLHSDKALWRTVGDAEGPADLNKALEVLGRLSQLQTTPLIKDSVTDLKPYGLDKPQGKITIQSPEYKQGLTLLIGKAENKLIYVRNSVEPFIYTLPDNAFDFLAANNMQLRDPRVMNVPLSRVKNMNITIGSGATVKLERSPGGTWSVENAKDRMVDPTKADTQASLICQLQARTWLGHAQPSYGLSKPVLTISIMADKLVTLYIGATLPDGNHAAQFDGMPVAFSISDGDYGVLNASSLQLMPAELAPTNTPGTNASATNAPAAKPPETTAPTKKH